MINSYPKVYALGHANIRELLFDDVIVEEKIDGSALYFGIFNGILQARSHKKEIILNAPEKMFTKGIDVIKEMANKLHDGWIYRGEYLQKPHHNTLTYSRVPINTITNTDNYIIIYDINTGLEEYLSYNDKLAECERLGFEVVPLLYQGKVASAGDIYHLLDTVSVLGGVNIEGIVLKSYFRFDKSGHALMGKYVSEKFKEVHNKSWGKANPSTKDVTARLIETYKTDARWEKAIYHMKENGILLNTPQDIGELIKSVRADIIEECKDEIKNKLYAHFIPQILRGVTGGLPEWYKDRLMKMQFKEADDGEKGNE